MLRLYIGPAGAGKTAAVMEELHARVQAGRGGGLLLVPEQYSHEAERELCRRCGDSLSRYAEVVSFTGLARRVLSERGGAALPFLDKGGKLLCMALAVRAASHRLKVYDTARSRTELPELMLAASDELKSAGVSPEKLAEAAAACEGQLADKLSDAALILSAYEAVVSNGRADPSDRLDLLAEKLAAEGLGEGTAVYADGFIDFTRQERKVLRALLQRGAELTVCLTLDSLEGGSELFELSRKAARALLGDAGELGVEIELRRFEEVSGKAPALRFFAREMFGWSPERFGPADGALRLLRAESPTAECEAAAARILELVRAGCRWREIAVAVRGFEDYRPLLESVFRHYGVPLFLSRRSELLQKPLPALIERAYAILESGWDVEDLTDYMRTGLTGLSVEDCDTLENYVYKWQLRGGAWKRPAPWRQHPDGYGAEFTDETAARLAAIDRLRRRLAGPLLAFERRSAEASTASGQAAALAAFLEDLRLPELLARRAAALRAGGQAALADETRQLWEIVVGALEQSEAILGDAEMDRAAFGKLFCRMLSTYDVGTIPVSLDRVTAGDFDRMRRRSLRHLIVLGAADSRLPPESAGGGLFTPEDREKLLTLDIDLGGTGDAELWREFSLIYNVLTLPSDSLTLCFAETDAAGEAQSPAFVYNRAAALFEDAERR
ncbi:MAG: ATP-dependent nuclease subunit B, partial [Oscillospiraceae bacterium]|nr:ATP-dependent nuclease subunit B [Oscillospiraceae bacterium]